MARFIEAADTPLSEVTTTRIIRAFTVRKKTEREISRNLMVPIAKVRETLERAGLIEPTPVKSSEIRYAGEIRCGDWFQLGAGVGAGNKRGFVWGSCEDGTIELRRYGWSGEGDAVGIYNASEVDLRTLWECVGPNENPMATVVCGPWRPQA
jgi:hypothetical protein